MRYFVKSQKIWELNFLSSDTRRACLPHISSQPNVLSKVLVEWLEKRKKKKEKHAKVNSAKKNSVATFKE